MRRYVKAVGLLLVASLVAVQLVPIERTNPMGAGDPEAPRNVQWTLRRACYDCHSGETRWPIWAYVAPVSWLVVRDVERGRNVLNFSDWAEYDRSRRIALQTMIGLVTASHRMPLWYYLTLHPGASLSDAELVALEAWSRAAAAENVAPPDPQPR